jgi:hypothetical protein
MQYRCSKHSVILSETRMRRTRVTTLCYLAATDASGSIARQQKITHAHESPFYHYAQFPHPFAISYRGEKKYSRYFLDSPRIHLGTRRKRVVQVVPPLPCFIHRERVTDKGRYMGSGTNLSHPAQYQLPYRVSVNSFFRFAYFF